jgi:uncharacterized protein YyaL (SSP411 family)
MFQGKKTDSNNIYICLGQTCLEPVSNWEQAKEICEDLVGIE